MSHAGSVRGLTNWDLRHIDSNKIVLIASRSVMPPCKRRSSRSIGPFIQIAHHTENYKHACANPEFAMMVWDMADFSGARTGNIIIYSPFFPSARVRRSAPAILQTEGNPQLELEN